MYITEKLAITNIEIAVDSLTFHYQVDHHKFHTRIAYQDVDFNELQKQFSPDFIYSLVVHMAIMTGIKYCSLAPKEFDLTAYSPYISQEFLDLFLHFYNKIFAQHKYENDLHNYQGPEFTVDPKTLATKTAQSQIPESPTQVLVGNGGGKDSLLSIKLLERAQVPFSSFQYSHSIYGDAQKQHDIIDKLNAVSAADKAHKIDVSGDFMDEKILQEYSPKLTTLCDAETPASVMQVLPLMLTHGYPYLALGHERSADVGNLVWKKTGEEINHQWGKGFEAEKLLNTFIKDHLVTNFEYFSLLKPLYDYAIFNLLKREQQHIHLTSSCNVDKPWCKRCPKCAYVWLGYLAYLDTDIINGMFQENPFDVPELHDTYLEMLGLQGHKPFECIGEIEEARLALYHCYKKGLTGKIIDIFQRDILPNEDFDKITAKYSKVYKDDQNLPQFMAPQVFQQMQLP